MGPARKTSSFRRSTSGQHSQHRRPSSRPGERDFVAENIMEAGTHCKSSEAPGPDGSEYLHKTNYGRVPTYLHKRNMELAANYAKQQVRKHCSIAGSEQ